MKNHIGKSPAEPSQKKARVIAEIEAGLEELAQGHVISHEEMERRIKEWKQNR